jgi:hypothetical protein
MNAGQAVPGDCRPQVHPVFQAGYAFAEATRQEDFLSGITHLVWDHPRHE